MRVQFPVTIFMKYMYIGADQTAVLQYRMAGITESAMVAYTHKYAVV